MELNFKGKRALITGAGKGIGREVARKLAEYGAVVIALSRSNDQLVTLKQEMPSIQIVCVDVGDWDSTKIAVEKIGHVDLLVNNAGMWSYGLLDQITEEEFDKVFSVHVKGTLNISQIVAKKMKEKGTGGAIVNVSSALSSRASEGTAIYGASKAAADHMAKVMAIELGPHNVRVNVVNPCLVRTGMSEAVWSNENMCQFMTSKIPLGRICEIKDVVDAILYLLSDRASMVHGANIYVDGGVSIH